LTIILTDHGIRDHHGALCAGLSMPKEKMIYLDTTSTHWKEAKTALTLHELGHYVLERHHDSQYIEHPLYDTHASYKFHIPRSIMTILPKVKEAYLLDDPFLRDYYMNELFNGP
jgi:hypothetical protein